MKLSVQYKMLYETPKKKISKSFVKKAKGNIWSSFFSWKLKDRLNPFWFYFHAFLSIMVLIGAFQSVVYVILAIARYKLHEETIIWAVVYLDIVLSLIRILEQIFGKLKR